MLSLIRARERNVLGAVNISSTPRTVDTATLYVRLRSESPINMPLFPLVQLEDNPLGFTRLDVDYIYVVRRGRGRSRRNYFVRATPGRTLPYDPPPWRVPSSWSGTGSSSRSVCGPNCGCRIPRRAPTSSTCRSLHRSRGRRSPRRYRNSYPTQVDSSTTSDSDSDSGSGSDSETATEAHSRHVHWPDNRSDGSLSPVPSLSSSSSRSSSTRSSDRGGGCRLPRTPSSSPERGSGMPSSGCSGHCRSRTATTGGGARWREASCWDERLGSGVIREPRR